MTTVVSDSVFGSAFGVTTTLVKTEDGKWIYKHVTDEMKNLLAFYAQLYADGMIDPEYLTNTWDVAEEKFYSGKAAMLIGKTGATINVYDNSMQATNGADAALTVLPPAKSELGQYCAAVDVSEEERGRVISADSEVKEAAFAIFDFMASPEGRVLDLYGVEGFHYNIVDNKIVPIEGAPDWYGVFYDSLIGLENIPLRSRRSHGRSGPDLSGYRQRVLPGGQRREPAQRILRLLGCHDQPVQRVRGGRDPRRQKHRQRLERLCGGLERRRR